MSKLLDYLNGLLAVSNTPSGSGVLPAAFNYASSSANRRTAVTQADQSRLGGKKYWSDGSPVTGEAGDLDWVAYSDGTPNVTNTLDRLGRPATVVCNCLTTTLGYNTVGALVSETTSGATSP